MKTKMRAVNKEASEKENDTNCYRKEDLNSA